MMAVARTLFRATAPMGLPLCDVMMRINRELCRDNERAVFVTAWAGCLDLDTGDLEVANAGHNPPFWLGRDGALRPVLATNSVAFGVLDDAAFPVTPLHLQPDDGLVIYTDGATDAVDPRGAGFGIDRLRACLQTLACESARQIVEGVFADVDAFSDTAPQEDDITVLVLRFRGAASPRRTRVTPAGV
jgi:sigma-B regulation protein RsbU (phosphoserine phosphatase)